ncbi:MAG: AAA family ATPase [Caulobacter sp.]|nr:AAA family ATPase [Caulobacter sp.]
MSRHILTGAPGAGKTVILRGLERAGLAVVEEAATDVIAWADATGVERHWEDPGFCDAILALQQQREANAPAGTVIFDRSPVCTLALSRFLGRDPSAALQQAAAGCRARYAPAVFFIESLPTIVNTAARRITLEEALRFGALHREVYVDLGFRLIDVPPGPAAERRDAVLGQIPGSTDHPNFRSSRRTPGPSSKGAVGPA